tara:strand:+ start:524 stop:682 length:159 start_codon:yes stop_codon:yes gene_type:complete
MDQDHQRMDGLLVVAVVLDLVVLLVEVVEVPQLQVSLLVVDMVDQTKTHLQD